MQVYNHRKVNEFVLEALIDYILSSGMKKGDKLPSQVEMAQQMNVSATSLRETIARLEARGILKQVQGIGTFVTLNPDEYKTNVYMETSVTDMIRATGKVPGTSEVILEWRPLPPEFSDVPWEGDQFIFIQRIRTADGEPFAVSIGYLLPGLIQSPDELQIHKHNESLQQFLEEYCGEVVTYFDGKIEIALANDEMAQKLKISPSEPILKFIRRQYNQEGRLLIASSEYFKGKTIPIKVTRYRPFQENEKSNWQEELHK